MILQLFADESGRINPVNAAKGDLSPVVCAYINTPDNWKIFAKKWQQKLNDYRAEYFHFREFANPDLYTKSGNAYYGWSKKQRHKFLYDLAYLCSESAVPEGCVFDVRDHLKSQSTDSPVEISITNFYKAFQIGIDR